jgi:hypothetical protein
MSLTKVVRKDRPTTVTDLQGPARLADAIAAALHRQYDGSRNAIKAVMRVTGASERTVKNWFQGKNGPNGEMLVALCECSDEVLETVLTRSNRISLLQHKKVAEMQDVLRQMLELLQSLSSSSASKPGRTGAG